MSKKRIPRLSKAKVKALELIKKEPNATKMEIGRKLMKLGLVAYPEKIYELTRSGKYNDYMHGEIAEVRQKNFERMSRDIVPLALSEHERLLKDKKMTKDQKLKAIDMAERREFGTDENKRPVYPIGVNIEQIQAIIYNSLTDKIDKPIEITEEDQDDV